MWWEGWLIRKDLDAGKDWGQEEKWAIEDEMAGWHHRLSGLNLNKLSEIVKDREAWHTAIHGSQRVGHNWTTEQQQHSQGRDKVLI